MLIKSRHEPLELKFFKILNNRMSFNEEEKTAFWALKKGFKGEKAFDEISGQLPDDYLVINDLFLTYNNNFFQLDTLIIADDTTYLFEIKNYEGDYFIENDLWYSVPKTEIKNPLLQLARSESLFRRFISDIGFRTTIKSYVVFINPQFTLYQAPLNAPIIFSSQIHRFFNVLHSRPLKLQNRHIQFANHLVSKHIKYEFPQRLPYYNYNNLKKGITCPSCYALIQENKAPKDRNVLCTTCGKSEGISSAISQSIEEFSLLFPERKITTNNIHDWCKIIRCKKTIRRTLAQNYSLLGHSSSSYYVNQGEGNYIN